MKNLSKKIGVGVVASSLVVGGAVSTGLVANAESSVEQSQITQSDRIEKLNKLNNLGDLQIVKLARETYKFNIFGYYFIESSSNIRKMEDDIDEVSKYAQGKGFEGYEKISKLEKTLPKELLENVTDVNNIDGKFDFKFKDGKEFIEYLYTDGMGQGVKKVKMGDAVMLLVFKDTVQPGKDWYDSEKISELEKTYVDVSDLDERDHLYDVLDSISKFLINYNNSSSVIK